MIDIQKRSANQYCFILKSESGHTLLQSISFLNKKEVSDMIKSLSRIVGKSNVFERKTNHKGQFLFNFNTDNGTLIGSSQYYNSEAGMENGIKNLKNRIEVLRNLKQL